MPGLTAGRSYLEDFHTQHCGRLIYNTFKCFSVCLLVLVFKSCTPYQLDDIALIPYGRLCYFFASSILLIFVPPILPCGLVRTSSVQVYYSTFQNFLVNKLIKFCNEFVNRSLCRLHKEKDLCKVHKYEQFVTYL